MQVDNLQQVLKPKSNDCTPEDHSNSVSIAQAISVEKPEEPNLRDEEKAFLDKVHRVGSLDKPQLYGEEYAGDEDLSTREQLILNLKSGTLDKLSDFAGILYEAGRKDMDSVAHAKHTEQDGQGDNILPSYSSLEDGKVRIYVRNLINNTVAISVQFLSDGKSVPGGGKVGLDPRKGHMLSAKILLEKSKSWLS